MHFTNRTFVLSADDADYADKNQENLRSSVKSADSKRKSLSSACSRFLDVYHGNAVSGTFRRSRSDCVNQPDTPVSGQTARYQTLRIWLISVSRPAFSRQKRL